jgi:flagellar motor switch/type III secretory pathway protein FliN
MPGRRVAPPDDQVIAPPSVAAVLEPLAPEPAAGDGVPVAAEELVEEEPVDAGLLELLDVLLAVQVRVVVDLGREELPVRGWTGLSRSRP